MPSAEKRRKPRGFKQSRNGLREAILGLLAIRPMTGYDLSRSYRRALQQIWYAPLGQVYPTLRKMRRDGLLRVSVKVQRHRPNRKIYSLTAEVRSCWSCGSRNRPSCRACITSSFTSCFSSAMSTPAGRGELVEVYIKRCREWLPCDFAAPKRCWSLALKGPNAENAWFQLLSLRHLCRIVECEADSARQIADGIRDHSRTSVDVRERSRRPRENAAFAGQTLSPTA